MNFTENNKTGKYSNQTIFLCTHLLNKVASDNSRRWAPPFRRHTDLPGGDWTRVSFTVEGLVNQNT